MSEAEIPTEPDQAIEKLDPEPVRHDIAGAEDAEPDPEPQDEDEPAESQGGGDRWADQ